MEVHKNGSDGKEAACNVGDPGLIPGSGDHLEKNKRQPTPVLLPRKSHEQRSLEGYSPWSRKESDTTEQLTYTRAFNYTKLNELLEI